MKGIVLIGGAGTGKSTVAKMLASRIPNAEYLYGSRYLCRVPMVIYNCDSSKLPEEKEDYLRSIVGHKDVPMGSFPREAMDDFVDKVMEKYGERILAEVIYNVMDPSKINILDNSARVSNVQFHKKHGFLVFGLTCSFETQVKRRLKDARDVDHTDEVKLRADLKRSMEWFEVDEILPLAEEVYGTDVMSPEEVVEAILKYNARHE